MATKTEKRWSIETQGGALRSEPVLVDVAEKRSTGEVVIHWRVVGTRQGYHQIHGLEGKAFFPTEGEAWQAIIARLDARVRHWEGVRDRAQEKVTAAREAAAQAWLRAKRLREAGD